MCRWHLASRVRVSVCVVLEVTAQSATSSHNTTNAHHTRNAPPPNPQLFTDAFSRDHQLIWAEPRQHTFLATALMLRGAASVGDAQRNVARIRGGLRLATWNEEVGEGGGGGALLWLCCPLS
jgi:hypothetical protein